MLLDPLSSSSTSCLLKILVSQIYSLDQPTGYRIPVIYYPLQEEAASVHRGVGYDISDKVGDGDGALGTEVCN